MEKMALKETVMELSIDKDEDVAEKAKEVATHITEADIDFCHMEKIAQRNNTFLAEEERMRQR